MIDRLRKWYSFDKHYLFFIDEMWERGEYFGAFIHNHKYMFEFKIQRLRLL